MSSLKSPLCPPSLRDAADPSRDVKQSYGGTSNETTPRKEIERSRACSVATNASSVDINPTTDVTVPLPETSNEAADSNHPTTSDEPAGLTSRKVNDSGHLVVSTSGIHHQKTVYDAYGNEVGYNKHLPHKRHPDTAAAMDRYIGFSEAMGIADPSTQDFNSRIANHSLPKAVSEPTFHSDDDTRNTASAPTFDSSMGALPEATAAASFPSNRPQTHTRGHSMPTSPVLSPTVKPSGQTGPRIQVSEDAVKPRDIPWYERVSFSGYFESRKQGKKTHPHPNKRRELEKKSIWDRTIGYF